MSIYVIGDIHGHLKVLETLINKLNLHHDDHLVFVGDYVDRGPNSLGVIKYIHTLKEKYKITTLIGNHEILMMKSLMIMQKNKNPNLFLYSPDERNYVMNWTSDRNGGSKTLESLMDRVHGDNDIIAKFWAQLIPYISLTVDGKDYTICHSLPADVVHDSRNDHKEWTASTARLGWDDNSIYMFGEDATNGIEMDVLQLNYSNKTIVHGHTPVMSTDRTIDKAFEYKVGSVNFINIDIGCAFINYQNDYKDHDSIYNLCALRLGDEMKFYAFD